MGKLKLLFLILFLSFFLISTFIPTQKNDDWIKINWVDNIEGDFSFKNTWSYPEGVYRNRFGQLSCDGICPLEIDKMKDEKGKIYEDSLNAFYKLVDTTHLFHSLKSKAKVYEWSGTNFISFNLRTDGSVLGQTNCNVSTHSELNIKIKNDSVMAWIDFNSIRDLGKHIFPLKEGKINIVRDLYENGIVMAQFDMLFENTIDLNYNLSWNGLIYSKIEQ